MIWFDLQLQKESHDPSTLYTIITAEKARNENLQIELQQLYKNLKLVELENLSIVSFPDCSGFCLEYNLSNLKVQPKTGGSSKSNRKFETNHNSVNDHLRHALLVLERHNEQEQRNPSSLGKICV